MNDLTAIILCGGKGERLRPFTQALPKPLIPLHGRPLLYHLMHYLSLWGIRSFVLCTGYQSGAIEKFIQDECDTQWQIKCSNAGEDASITDRLLHARAHVQDKSPVLICYGDTLANVDLNLLKQTHENNRAAATLTVYALHSPFGIVSFHEGAQCVRGFEEKPVLPYWINIGFLFCSSQALDFLKPHTDMPEFLQSLAQAGLLVAYKHNGQHLTINTEKELTEAKKMIPFFTVSNGENT